MMRQRLKLAVSAAFLFGLIALFAPRCAAQVPIWPDFVQLQHEAAETLTPGAPVLAIAWVESAADTNPHLRAHYCWNARRHDADCEVGRFQIKPSTAKHDCPGLDVFTTYGNHACFFSRFGHTLGRYGIREAIREHHGGTAAQNALYLARVERLVTELALSDILPLSPACRREIVS